MDDPREPLGRLVREKWVAWALSQPHPKPSWLVPWEELDDGQREADMQIGEVVAAFAVSFERERIRQLAIRVHAVCTGDDGAISYFAALIGEPPQERGEEKDGKP